MRNRNVIASIVGNIFFIISGLELIPAIFDYLSGSQDYIVFLESAFLTSTLGGVLMLGFRGYDNRTINRKVIYLITTILWITTPLSAALPLYFAIPHISFAGAVFESVSGLTTTGSTVLTNLDHMPRGILIWRAILQWIGGVGIIVLGIWVLPILQVGGMALFKTESSDQSEKIYPRTIELIKRILSIYIFITLCCILAYHLLGMNLFDSLAHALSTVSTGGFSTHDQSLNYFHNSAIEWAAIIFMLASAVPFIAYIRCLKGSIAPLFSDAQARALVIFLATTSLVLSVSVWHHSDLDFFAAFRNTLFSVVSIVTTTGFVTMDYTTVGAAVASTFLILTLVGGSTGSTAGGIKIFRFAVLWQTLRSVFYKMIYPNGIYNSQYHGRTLTPDVTMSVMVFICVFLMFLAFLAIALGFAGMMPLEAFSAAATAIANVGPGMGGSIGPSGNFTEISTSAKWLMSLGMIVGRLEFLTVFVLFSPHYWKDV